jgi:hypothetical protein
MGRYNSKYPTLPERSAPSYGTEYKHLTGRSRPLAEATDIGMYLGVYVAERALSKFFDNIIRMPLTNPGYDFLCGKGFKIDVKSACRDQRSKNSRIWNFQIKKNAVPDYFLCIAFDNRESLTPEHVWLIPSKIIAHLTHFIVADSTRSKWSEYEKPLDRVLSCCREMRARG